MPASIYVAYHKKVGMIELASLKYMLCGAALKGNAAFMPGTLRDDSGDNISALNPYFCECSAIYWAWKNDFVSDYIGLMHYRRFLNFSTNPAFGRIPEITQEQIDNLEMDTNRIESLCQKYDLILPKQLNFNMSIYNQLKSCKDIRPYDISLKIIEDYFPYLQDSAKIVNQSHYGYYYNIFIMRRDLFDDYCAFLFHILFAIHNGLSDSGNLDSYKRYSGFIAERLSSIYFHYMKYKLNVRHIEFPISFVIKP